jgi:hypothetical protein
LTDSEADGSADSAWARLTNRSRNGAYLLLIASIGFFTAVVFYVDHVNSITGSETFITSFAPFVFSLLLMGFTSIFLSVYVATRRGGYAHRCSGGFWMLLLLPISMSLYNDFTFVDDILIILIVVSAIMLWREHRDTEWFVIVGVLTTIWFVFDPLTHTLDYLSLSAGSTDLGIVHESASLALQRGIADWFRLGFFFTVFIATLKGK